MTAQVGICLWCGHDPVLLSRVTEYEPPRHRDGKWERLGYCYDCAHIEGTEGRYDEQRLLEQEQQEQGEQR